MTDDTTNTEHRRVAADCPHERLVMRFDHWFDPYNPSHMKAYEHLCNNGCWPEGFIPEGTEIPTLWAPEIQAKMSQAWLHAMKHGRIIGSAPFDA